MSDISSHPNARKKKGNKGKGYSLEQDSHGSDSKQSRSHQQEVQSYDDEVGPEAPISGNDSYYGSPGDYTWDGTNSFGRDPRDSLELQSQYHAEVPTKEPYLYNQAAGPSTSSNLPSYQGYREQYTTYDISPSQPGEYQFPQQADLYDDPPPDQYTNVPKLSHRGDSSDKYGGGQAPETGLQAAPNVSLVS